MLSLIKDRNRALPSGLIETLIASRHKRGWSQSELGQRVGLPQMHISGIETGKVVPRFDTLLELVRALDYDLVLVPREFVPVVESLSRNRNGAGLFSEDESPLYLPDEGDERVS